MKAKIYLKVNLQSWIPPDTDRVIQSVKRGTKRLTMSFQVDIDFHDTENRLNNIQE